MFVHACLDPTGFAASVILYSLAGLLAWLQLMHLVSRENKNTKELVFPSLNSKLEEKIYILCIFFPLLGS